MGLFPEFIDVMLSRPEFASSDSFFSRTRDYLADGCSEMLRWPLFAWLQPKAVVRLFRDRGLDSLVSGVSLTPAPAGFKGAATAVLLPDDGVLVHQLTLPDLGESELAHVVEREFRANSPFAPESAVWGWATTPLPEDRLKVSIAIAERSQALSYMESLVEQSRVHDCEVWAEGADGAVIVLGGFGGRSRRRLERRGLFFRVLLLLGILLQLCALCALPVWVERGKAIEAIGRLEEVTKLSRDAVFARDMLSRTNQAVQAARSASQDKIDVPLLVETLTQAVPDEASLSRLEINGRHVKIIGMAANGSGLLEVLSGRPEFQEVRATSPISRQGGAKKDSFVIELVVAPTRSEK